MKTEYFTVRILFKFNGTKKDAKAFFEGKQLIFDKGNAKDLQSGVIIDKIIVNTDETLALAVHNYFNNVNELILDNVLFSTAKGNTFYYTVLSEAGTILLTEENYLF